MDEERKARLETLRKILALANHANTNKALAMAAIEKARKYAADYGLTLAEAEKLNDFSEFGAQAAYSGSKQYGFVDRCLWKTIAEFCRVKVGVGTDKDGDLTISFFGHNADVMLAHWLRDTIKAAMAFEWGVYRDFVMEKGSNLPNKMTSFHMGMANELRSRMARVSSEDTATSDSCALVVKKWALVNAAAEAAGFKEAREGRGRSVNVDTSAYNSGCDAGRRVDIGRGVAARASKMIGQY